jgi:hypothetical protein
MALIGLSAKNPRSKQFRFTWLSDFRTQNGFCFDGLLKIRVQNGSCFLVSRKSDLKMALKLFTAEQESTF